MAESAKAATDKAQASGSSDPKPVVPFDTTTSDAVDPRTGDKFKANPANAGRSGFDQLSGDSPGGVPNVDPKRIPAEVTPGVTPDAGRDSLLAAAQAAAPNLTREIADSYELGDDVLAAIARREVPPPPAVGPIHTSDLYLTPGGWQNVPPGVAPEEVGKNSISR
jgi:hypothetical protein